MNENNFIETALDLGSIHAFLSPNNIYVAWFDAVKDAIAFTKLCKEDTNITKVVRIASTVRVKFFRCGAV